MTNESINEQLKKLLAKVKSIQGSQLSMGKRLTALEDKEPEEYKIPLITVAETALIAHLWKHLGPSLPPMDSEEVDEDKEIEKKLVIEATEDVEEVIDPEVLDSLDEIIEAE